MDAPSEMESAGSDDAGVCLNLHSKKDARLPGTDPWLHALAVDTNLVGDRIQPKLPGSIEVHSLDSRLIVTGSDSDGCQVPRSHRGWA
jgi:hypothetical protein